MRKRVFSLLLICIFSVGALVGCGSPEKTVEELLGKYYSGVSLEEDEWIDLIKAYEKMDDEDNAHYVAGEAAQAYPHSEKLKNLLDKYLDEAPIPECTSGSEEGAKQIVFNGMEQESGKLYVTVDNPLPASELVQMESRPEEGVFIFDYPSDYGFEVMLHFVGNHTVRAFAMQDGNLNTQVFEEVYEVVGEDYSGFGFAQEEGEHNAPFTLSFVGTKDATVYYTSDGTDPLYNIEFRTELEENSLTLPSGETTITARCMDGNGIVSPLITGTFDIAFSFDSNTIHVGEDDVYEYVGSSDFDVKRYRKMNGENGELEHVGWNPTHLLVSKPYLYIRTSSGDIKRAYLNDDEIWAYNSWETVADWSEMRMIGDGWFYHCYKKYEGGSIFTTDEEANWVGKGDPIGTEAVAKIADLLTAQRALWVEKNHKVMTCTPNGKNVTTLWTTDDYVTLDAMTDTVVFYHNGGVGVAPSIHMIYDLETGEHRKNNIVPDGCEVLGYTSGAVYYKNGKNLVREAIDYSKL